MVASGKRAVERCDHLGGGVFSDSPDFLFRPYLGKGHLEALEQVGLWMSEAGMTTRLDPAGNLIGRYSPAPFMGRGDREAVGRASSQRALMIASHIDSVRDGGKYDGPLGVMLGIEVVAALHEAGRKLPFAIEVYAFGDEEGSRFPAAMLTSRAVAGVLSADALDVGDRDGISLETALREAGLDIATFKEALRDPTDFIGYLEAHIEQGPALEAEGLALGVVTAIAAQLRFEVVVTGVAGHAGTNSMSLRKDALTAAAEMVLAIEKIASAGPDDLVATVGRMTVGPGAPNVVPGRVEFTIDVRAGLASIRDAAAEEIVDAITEISVRRPIDLALHRIHNLPPAPCDPHLMDLLDQAVAATGQKTRRMVSGAGHDAMILGQIMPAAMLFIRCRDGISHNPLEHIDPADADAALKAMLTFIDLLEASL